MLPNLTLDLSNSHIVIDETAFDLSAGYESAIDNLTLQACFAF